ncbi:Hypothetical predicted protein [Lecanosticta acicola]|uniref:Carboxylesterase type B domain-containing protein n=1 Tax=Lecanosticta acicola TaxID=111012 RepID=A0AAI9E7B7_9PEZI|nr:Hypothetical predicted protein [Lecanosticta acicola]
MGVSNSTERDYTHRTARGSLIGIEVVDIHTKQPIYRRFTRIRYAFPPRGDRRWRKPEPLPPDWIFSNGNNNPRDYSKFGAICPQTGIDDAVRPEKWAEGESNEMDEDCLFLNVWTPPGGEGPRGGWPVQFDVPGSGFQRGSGMQHTFLDPVDIFRENRANPRIVVSPNFRCGVLGFLASEELRIDSEDSKSDPYAASGNYGLWDIRMAIEWTFNNVFLFGGNPYNICVGGDGRTTAFQLHFDAFHPSGRSIIRRAFLFSGAVCVQPAVAQSTKPRAQFAELCDHLNIDNDTLPSKYTVRLLRGVSAEKLMSVVQKMDTTFDPITDGQDGFIPTDFMQSIWSGALGRRLKERTIQVLIGDPSGERCVYERLMRKREEGIIQGFPRIVQNRQALITSLSAYYPETVVNALVAKYSIENKDWSNIHCDIMADVECHAAVRGFAHGLAKGGMTAQDVLRYHIAWKCKALDQYIDPGTGVCHAMDVPIWWHSGWRAGFSERDKQDVLNFTEPFARFLRGDISARSGWGTDVEADVRLLCPDGAVIVGKDPLWKSKLEVWNVVQNAQRSRHVRGGSAGSTKTLPTMSTMYELA